MKVAIATKGGQVSEHFGPAHEFTIAEIEQGKLIKMETVPNPGHRPGFLPSFLADEGVTHVITGGVGQRAQELFKQYNIELILGVTGKVDQVVEEIRTGNLRGGESLCQPGSGKGYGVEKEEE